MITLRSHYQTKEDARKYKIVSIQQTTNMKSNYEMNTDCKKNSLHIDETPMFIALPLSLFQWRTCIIGMLLNHCYLHCSF